MKRIGLTQRVDTVHGYGERRDGLDQRWSKLFAELGYEVVALPNRIPVDLDAYLTALNLSALALTGGNSLTALDSGAEDIAPERDELEIALLEWASSKSFPLLGVCRGMQMMNHYYGGKLVTISGHVATDHRLISLTPSYKFSAKVNSYHNWCIPAGGLACELQPIATDEPGNIEAFIHPDKPQLGIMWHPEREAPFKPEDLALLKAFL
jgi:putative glutamine amidotransferase